MLHVSWVRPQHKQKYVSGVQRTPRGAAGQRHSAHTRTHIIWLVNSASSPFLSNGVTFSSLTPPPSVNFILPQNWMNARLFRFAPASSPGSVPLHSPQEALIV
ncbi:hypothetical protein TRVL_10298 [Trypanosoma vivax]|nr:hypothetical protein TRVL_10298 [Trypanosoma vivax]